MMKMIGNKEDVRIAQASWGVFQLGTSKGYQDPSWKLKFVQKNF